MLNPSTADASLDDPTIRRCKAFAAREGLGRLIVVNLFTLRSPSPRELWCGDDPVGPDADDAIWKAIKATHHHSDVPAWRKEGIEIPEDKIICAWGALPSGAPEWFARMRQERIATVLDRAARIDRRLWALGTTSDGSPRHPLYVRADAPLTRYSSSEVGP
jgi:hypothetical protein